MKAVCTFLTSPCEYPLHILSPWLACTSVARYPPLLAPGSQNRFSRPWCALHSSLTSCHVPRSRLQSGHRHTLVVAGCNDRHHFLMSAVNMADTSARLTASLHARLGDQGTMAAPPTARAAGAEHSRHKQDVDNMLSLLAGRQWM